MLFCGGHRPVGDAESLDAGGVFATADCIALCIDLEFDVVVGGDVLQMFVVSNALFVEPIVLQFVLQGHGAMVCAGATFLLREVDGQVFKPFCAALGAFHELVCHFSGIANLKDVARQQGGLDEVVVLGQGDLVTGGGGIIDTVAVVAEIVHEVGVHGGVHAHDVGVVGWTLVRHLEVESPPDELSAVLSVEFEQGAHHGTVGIVAAGLLAEGNAGGRNQSAGLVVIPTLVGFHTSIYIATMI